MKIIPLSEGSFTIDKTKLFVPFDTQKDELQQRPAGSLLVEIQPFVVITSRDILVLDTGLGFHDNAADGTMQIHSNLAKAGINSGDVTKVLMTHLHKDHAGGITLEHDHTQLSFPNATYYVQGRELEFALRTGMPTFMTNEFEALQTSPQVVKLDADTGTIDDYISYQLTSAHSPFHQVFWIREGEEIIFFGGDDAPQLQQMKIRYKTKYDSDPDKAMNLRQEWWKRGSDEGWTFLFYHDIGEPFWRINN